MTKFLTINDILRRSLSAPLPTVMDSIGTTGLKKISQSWLPDNLKDEMDFVESSFFKTAGQKLPCPQHLSTSQEGVIIISEMQLAIKFGSRVTIDEAVTMWVVRKCLGHQVPVPELFGWRIYQNTVFIYMELVSGATLQETLERHALRQGTHL